MNAQPRQCIVPESADDEVAAVLAAVQAFLDAEQEAGQQPAATQQASGTGWHHSAKLTVQGLQPTKTTRRPRWSTIERQRLVVSSFSGVIGL